MAEYGKILLIAMPAFLVLVVLEKLYGMYKENDTVPLDDTVSSLSSGMSNVLKDVLGLSVSIITYEWMVDHFALVTIENNILVYVIAFVVIDLYGYLTHRLSHKINLFWNEHVIHHSSEEFNLACALRQPVSTIVRFFTILLIPASIMGVPAEVIATILPLHLFMQFWYHTRHINKMGFLEYILVTPSHHRVHHAINPEYLDTRSASKGIFLKMRFLIYTNFVIQTKNKKKYYHFLKPKHNYALGAYGPNVNTAAAGKCVIWHRVYRHMRFDSYILDAEYENEPLINFKNQKLTDMERLEHTVQIVLETMDATPRSEAVVKNDY